MTLASNIFRNAAGPWCWYAGGAAARACADLTRSATRHAQLARDSAWPGEFLTSPTLVDGDPLRGASLAIVASALLQAPGQSSGQHTSRRTSERTIPELSRARATNRSGWKEKLPTTPPFRSAHRNQNARGIDSLNEVTARDSRRMVAAAVEPHRQQFSRESGNLGAPSILRVLSLPAQVEEHFLRQSSAGNSSSSTRSRRVSADAGSEIPRSHTASETSQNLPGGEKTRPTTQSSRSARQPADMPAMSIPFQQSQRTRGRTQKVKATPDLLVALPSLRSRHSTRAANVSRNGENSTIELTSVAVREWQDRTIRRAGERLRLPGGHIFQEHDVTWLAQQWEAGIQGLEASAELLQEVQSDPQVDSFPVTRAGGKMPDEFSQRARTVKPTSLLSDARRTVEAGTLTKETTEQRFQKETSSSPIRSLGDESFFRDSMELGTPRTTRMRQQSLPVAVRQTSAGAMTFEPTQSRRSMADEDLSGLAERMKRILDEEARRHGIDV